VRRGTGVLPEDVSFRISSPEVLVRFPVVDRRCHTRSVVGGIICQEGTPPDPAPVPVMTGLDLMSVGRGTGRLSALAAYGESMTAGAVSWRSLCSCGMSVPEDCAKKGEGGGRRRGGIALERAWWFVLATVFGYRWRWEWRRGWGRARSILCALCVHRADGVRGGATQERHEVVGFVVRFFLPCLQASSEAYGARSIRKGVVGRGSFGVMPRGGFHGCRSPSPGANQGKGNPRFARRYGGRVRRTWEDSYLSAGQVRCS
jgi:hypothetical protein